MTSSITPLTNVCTIPPVADGMIVIFALYTCSGDESYKPNPRLARVLDILFILHSDHEMNCSRATRHLASSGVDSNKTSCIKWC
ncbi:citrate synthase 3, peroxisomal [Artemisia annua]|uniref:Citrate synthase 3, peroxisomal n=1 Tax=Artemisia annua TaxID=35608 RepID=A0A2U1KGH0_ARTAN|nr:citrate synthase 3, peroxisomal [Artemisia annua]